MLLFYKTILWLMFSIRLYNSLNHEVEMGLGDVQSMWNETLETEKGSSCIYLRSKNRATEANIRQRFRCGPPKCTDFDVACLWFIFEYCESMRIGLRERRKLEGGNQTADCGRGYSTEWEYLRRYRGGRKDGSAGKCTTVDNGFIECEIAEFAGSTSRLAA